MNKKVLLWSLSPLMAEVLDNDGEVTFMLTGNSMFPLLRHRRDKVCIVKPQQSPLKKYDIPLFVRDNGKYVLHRIVAVKAEGYIILGDNQCVKEYQVLHTQVIGVVKGIWRDEKYISCKGFWYQAYCRAWVWIYPLRWIYLRARQVFFKMKRFLGDKAYEG